jgi:hypothetical protein
MRTKKASGFFLQQISRLVWKVSADIGERFNAEMVKRQLHYIPIFEH